MPRVSRKLLVSVFLLMLAGAALCVIFCHRPASLPASLTASVSTNSTNPAGDELAGVVRQLAALDGREREVSKTVWGKEMLAEECEEIFDSLWESLNVATNKFKILTSFPFGRLVGCNFKPAQLLAHGIELREPSGAAGPLWSAA